MVSRPRARRQRPLGGEIERTCCTPMAGDVAAVDAEDPADRVLWMTSAWVPSVTTAPFCIAMMSASRHLRQSTRHH